MKLIAKRSSGRRLGPVEEYDYKRTGSVHLGYKQVVVSSPPIDVKLAKQLNIRLGNLGVHVLLTGPGSARSPTSAGTCPMLAARPAAAF